MDFPLYVATLLAIFAYYFAGVALLYLLISLPLRLAKYNTSIEWYWYDLAGLVTIGVEKRCTLPCFPGLFWRFPVIIPTEKYEELVKIWPFCKTHKEVADKIGVQVKQVAGMVNLLRKHGVPLRKLERSVLKGRKPLDYGRLKELAGATGPQHNFSVLYWDGTVKSVSATDQTEAGKVAAELYTTAPVKQIEFELVNDGNKLT